VKIVNFRKDISPCPRIHQISPGKYRPAGGGVKFLPGNFALRTDLYNFPREFLSCRLICRISGRKLCPACGLMIFTPEQGTFLNGIHKKKQNTQYFNSNIKNSRNMINNIKLTQLRNDEFIQFIRDLLKIIETLGTNALQLLIQFSKLLETIAEAEKVYLQTRGSELTKKISEADTLRDNDISGIKLIAEAYTYHFDAAKVEAAELILSHIKKYGGNIAKMNYQAETTALNDFADHTENDSKLSAAIDLLGLREWLTTLKSNNIAFNELYMMRIDEQAGKPNGNLRELRAQSVEDYKELIKHLTAHATISPSDLYTKAINMINELIDKYNSLRRKRKDKGEDNGED